MTKRLSKEELNFYLAGDVTYEEADTIARCEAVNEAGHMCIGDKGHPATDHLDFNWEHFEEVRTDARSQ
jgi:hypothetical protein